jgi:hypothetical protein
MQTVIDQPSNFLIVSGNQMIGAGGDTDDPRYSAQLLRYLVRWPRPAELSKSQAMGEGLKQGDLRSALHSGITSCSS